MANVHVSLRLDEKLVAEIDADAERLERSRNWVISRRLENSRTLPPLYKLDRETGDISVMDEGEPGRSLGRTSSKKIADVSVRGTPRLPRLGKTEIGDEYSKPLLNSAGTECVRCHQPIYDHLTALCGGDDGSVVRTESGNGYTTIPAAAKKIAVESVPGKVGKPFTKEIIDSPTFGEPVARTPELMAGLRKIAAGKTKFIPAEQVADFASDAPDVSFEIGGGQEVDLCGERFHSEVDGEWYMCGKEKHPFPKVKHGDWIKV